MIRAFLAILSGRGSGECSARPGAGRAAGDRDSQGRRQPGRPGDGLAGRGAASRCGSRPPGFRPAIMGCIFTRSGRCEGPAFASAGPHWNPTGRQHGSLNPAGHHLGDLPNLDVDAMATAGSNSP